MPGQVHVAMALEALRRAKGDKQRAWSEYIRLHFQATGQLAPGCDAREFYAAIGRLKGDGSR